MHRSWKRSICVISACMLAALISVSASGQAASDHQPVDPAATLKEMSWLAGHWSGDMWGGRFLAYYSTPEGGKILSHSKLMKEGHIAFYEFEIFDATKDTLYLQPFPGGKPATGFPLKLYDPKARRAVFENPAKDYPTRIEYHRADDDRLIITLSNPFGDSGKSERFDLSRSPAAFPASRP